MKLLKTIRFDPSDDYAFVRAAGSGEFAVPGGFSFAELDRENLAGKRKQEFANGFLSIDSLGYSTFVTVVNASEEQVREFEGSLADCLLAHFGAPSSEAAGVAARQEIEFVCELCREVPINTVFTLRRFFDDSRAIKEEFRIVRPNAKGQHTRIWDVVEENH